MFHLAVIGVSDAEARELGSRVHGATLAAADESDAAGDAVAVLEWVHGSLQRVESSLAAGKPVLVSVQAGLSSEILQQLLELGRTSGGRLTMANPFRFLPSRMLIHQQIDAGKLGAPGLIRVHRWECAHTMSRNPTPSGSLLCDLDLATWCFDRWPTLVYAVGFGSTDSTERSGIQVHLGFPGGGMAMACHFDRLPSGDGYGSMVVIGSTGAAYSDDHQNTQLHFSGEIPRAIRTDEGIVSTTAMIQAFVRREHTSADATLAHWERIAALGEAVLESLETKRAVRPKVELP